ncbi:MAG: MGMT family protein [Ruminococcus sp.]|nr:MGMT family protein [Ruminococcus sp.]
MTEFESRVYDLVMKVPEGMVVTYGDIAKALGNRGLSRAVGNALHKNPFEGIVPCHRVANGEGKLAPLFVFGGLERQKQLLEFEGIEVINFKVDLEEYRYTF